MAMDAKGVIDRIKDGADKAVKFAADVIARGKPSGGESEPRLELHPDDADAAEWSDGEVSNESESAAEHEHEETSVSSEILSDAPHEAEHGALGWIDVRRAALEDADAVICGVPFETQDGRGAASAPADLRAVSSAGAFSSRADMKLIDLGDIVGSDRCDLFTIVEDTAAKLAAWGKPFAFVGGDGSISIPILRGIDRTITGRIGVVRLSATCAMMESFAGDRYSPRCAAARAAELRSVDGSSNIVFVGARDISREEMRALDAKSIVVSPLKIRRKGARKVAQKICRRLRDHGAVYVSIDVGVLDPAFAPGTSAQSFGGVDSVEMIEILNVLMSRLPVVAFDVTDAVPRRDMSGVTTSAALGIISTCWSRIAKRDR